MATSHRVLLLGVLAAAACGDAGTSVPAAAPAIVDTAGLQQWLAARRGSPVLVNFWATWCAPCVAELPDLLAGTVAFRERGGVVVAVAMERMVPDVTIERALAKASAKAAGLGLTVPVLVCSDDDMIAVRRQLGVELGGLPQTLAYDRAGRLVQQHEGSASAAEFAALAQAAER